MTAREIQRLIMIDCYKKQSFSCPNYTPKNWWECDVFELTKGGLFREYEIKLSRADFRADRYKAFRTWVNTDGINPNVRKKHDCLAAGDTTGPSYFSFVCPAGMLDLSEVPAWAGLVTAEERGSKWAYLSVAKVAPRLHRLRLDEKVRQHLFRTYYHRFQWWFLFRKDQEVAA